MDTVPLELEETPLKLETAEDAISKCIITESHSETTQRSDNSLLVVLPKDPLYKDEDAEPDFDKMTELEKLIYTERQRLLPPKKCVPTKICVRKKFSTIGLTENEKAKIRKKKRRAQETEDERNARKFRQRVGTLKQRLLQRLKNFDNEEYLDKVRKQNNERTKQRRLREKLMAKPEENQDDDSELSLKIRLKKLRRNVFKTPEEAERIRERRRESFKKYMATKTAEERRAYNARYREQAKARYRKNNEEVKKYDLILKGKTIEEIEAMNEEDKFNKKKSKEGTQVDLKDD